MNASARPADVLEAWRARLGNRSFRRTIVVSTVAMVTVAMLVVGLGLQLLLAWTAQRDIRQVLEDRSTAMIAVIARDSDHEVSVPVAALEPGMQVYAADGSLIAGTVQTRAEEVARDLARTTTPRFRSGPGEREMLLGTPFTTPGGASGVLVVSQETGPYERSETYALIATIVLGVLLVGATALIALRVTRQALAPVRLMAERAADWSEHDLDQRFDLGPPVNELAALGETLDHLLDRVASAILSEQRLTAELAHELRTPLTSIQGSADLARLRGVADESVRADLEQISLSAREMSGVITTLLDLAREGGGSHRVQTCVAADLESGLRSTVPEEAPVDLDLGDSTARIAAPADLVVRATAPVLDNAVRHAASRVVVRALDRPDRVLLRVTDDGAGVPEDLRESLFEPGVTWGTDGAGLGLGIARRVARSIGGEIDLTDDGPGTTFVISLPRR